MTVEQVGSRWVARSTYAEKDVVKAVGFRWDPGCNKYRRQLPEEILRAAKGEL